MASAAEPRGTPAAARQAWRRLMLTADAIGPAGLPPAQRAELERQMLLQLVRGMREWLVAVAVVLPLLVAWLLLPELGAVRAVGPALVVVLLSLERLLLLRRIRRQWPGPPDSTRRWARALTLRMLLVILVVVLWGHFVLQAGNEPLTSLTFGVFAFLSASAVSQYCSWPPAMWVTITPLLLGMAAQLAMMNATERLLEAGFACALWLVLALVGLRFGRLMHDNRLNALRNRELRQQLHERGQQLHQANTARARFLAAASHDLRQPLQAMWLYLDVMQPRRQDADAFARLHGCASALDHLLENLLQLSQLDTGRVVPKRRAFALQPVLDKVTGLFEAMARERGLQLRVRATDAWTHSDPVLLERVLSNLLSNAIRYTDRGGVLLAVRPWSGGHWLCVYDTGVGIPARMHATVFDEFVQLDNPERDSYRGHGLGLATVQRISRLLGHPLQLRSRSARGSCFALELPRVPPQPPDPGAEEAPALKPADRLEGQVLVVEDDENVRIGMAQLLGSWGLRVVAAADGGQAVAAMCGTAFDAVLCDWRLPGGMDGMAVLRHARTALPGLRVGALLTGENIRDLPGAEFDFPVLRKPVLPLHLRALLGPHLQPEPLPPTQHTHGSP